MTSPDSPESNPGGEARPEAPQRVSRPYCVFCNIVARKEPANIIYEDDDIIVIQNVLRWVPIMLLAMPKDHKTQADQWQDMAHVGRIATEIGKQLCPGGFRLLSNFGYDAMQSQEHAHLHILGGTFLGHYVG
jgi:histidine triad (HIT) family protein